MIASTDILVIGGGPSAAAFCARIAEKGLKVTVVCQGELSLPNLNTRLNDISGADKLWKFNSSQKNLSVTSLDGDEFCYHRIEGFGGLSNRWGAGMAKLVASDMGIPKEVSNAIRERQTFAERLLGDVHVVDDALSEYLGQFTSDLNARPAVRGNLGQLKKSTRHVQPGLTRQAIIYQERDNCSRKPCNECGQCGIACGRGSMFNAAFTLYDLRNVHQVVPESTALSIERTDSGTYIVKVRNKHREIDLQANEVVLACGPLETFRLVNTCRGSSAKQETGLASNVMLRGLAFNPFGKPSQPGPVGKVVARIQIPEGNAYASFVDGMSVPVSDWLSLLPIKNCMLARFIQFLRRYLIGYLIFFPSDYATNTIIFNDGDAIIKHRLGRGFQKSSRIARRRLKLFFVRNSIIPIPFLTSKLKAGSDIHYGGTLPLGEDTDINCQVIGLQNLFVIDGSWMPRISEKPHTFTLVANAARVADHIASISKELEVN